MISPARVISIALVAAVVILLLGTAAVKFGVPLGTAVQTTLQRAGFGRSSGLSAKVQEKFTASAAKFPEIFRKTGIPSEN